MLKKFNVTDSGISPNEQEQHGHYCYVLPRQGGEIETPGPMDVVRYFHYTVYNVVK